MLAQVVWEFVERVLRQVQWQAKVKVGLELGQVCLQELGSQQPVGCMERWMGHVAGCLVHPSFESRWL